MKTPGSFVKFHVPEAAVADFWTFVDEGLKAGAFKECEPNQEKSNGFASWDDAFDADFNKNVYHIGEYVCFNFRQDVRKVSKVLLKKFVKEQIEKYKEQNGHYPKKAQRLEIHENVYNALMARTLPQPSSYGVIWNPGAKWMILGATNTGLIEAFLEKFESVFKMYPKPLFHANFALEELGLNDQQKTLLNALVSVSAPTAIDDGKFIGFEFLTWLWYTIENQVGGFNIGNNTRLEIALGDRLTLCLPDEVKEQVSCVTQANSLVEAHTALQQGKMVKSIQLVVRTIGQDEREYIINIDTSLLAIKGMKTPKAAPPDDDDVDGYFLENMFFLEEVLASVKYLFGVFMNQRLDPVWNSDVLPKINGWIHGDD